MSIQKVCSFCGRESCWGGDGGEEMRMGLWEFYFVIFFKLFPV